MKYLTWKLKKINEKEFNDPTHSTNNDEVRIEPAFLNNSNIEDATVYAYWIRGSLNFDALTDWEVAEITQEQFLDAALILNESAYLNDDGVLLFLNNNQPI